MQVAIDTILKLYNEKLSLFFFSLLLNHAASVGVLEVFFLFLTEYFELSALIILFP